jgi:hypothetical protein
MPILLSTLDHQRDQNHLTVILLDFVCRYKLSNQPDVPIKFPSAWSYWPNYLKLSCRFENFLQTEGYFHCLKFHDLDNYRTILMFLVQFQCSNLYEAVSILNNSRSRSKIGNLINPISEISNLCCPLKKMPLKLKIKK